MSKANQELIELVKGIARDVATMKQAIADLQAENNSAAVNTEGLFKALNVKFDMLKNLETTSREAVQNTTSRSAKPTRPAFFKAIFAEERDQHLGTLYEQEDVDAALDDKDVKAKKKPTDASNKAASILYIKCIKGESNKARADAFERLYTSRYS